MNEPLQSATPDERSFAVPLLIWLAAAIGVGASGIFLKASPPQVAAIVWALTVAALVTAWKKPLDLRKLIKLHVSRLVGIALVGFYLAGRLPFSFGVLGGVGDILIAIGAIALLRGQTLKRAYLVIWNIVGLADIVLVVFTALREGLRDSMSMAALREFPLSLLPTFLVPLIIASHVLIFRRLATGVGVR